MMQRIHQRFSITATVILLAANMPAYASGKGRTKSFDSVEAVIAKLIESPPATKVQVEAKLATKLTENRITLGSASLKYEGKLVAKDGTIVTIDFREPVSPAATAGALLAFHFDGPCYQRSAVEKSFGPIKLVSIPNGHTPDGDFSYARQMPWGKLSFGYKESKPDCLKYVVFNRNKT